MNKNARPWTVGTITKMMGNGLLVTDNAIQRNLVWDLKRKSLFIDSLIRDYPVPPIYAIITDRKIETPKGEKSVYDLIDGKQRSTTITSFLNEEFALGKLEPFKTDEGEVDISGMKYGELPLEIQDALRNANLTVYSFDDATDDEITEVMARLNNGKPLSAIDNTRIKAVDLTNIHRLSEHSFFKNFFTEKAINGHQTEEIVIKTYMHLTNPESALENKQVRPVYESLVITDEIDNKLTKLFDTAEEIANGLSESKKILSKFLKKTHLISCFWLIDKMMEEGIDVEEMTGCIKSFFEDGSPSCDDDYNAACKNGSNHESNVIIRKNALEEHYKWYFRIDDTAEESEEESAEDDDNIFDSSEETVA